MSWYGEILTGWRAVVLHTPWRAHASHLYGSEFKILIKLNPSSKNTYSATSQHSVTYRAENSSLIDPHISTTSLWARPPTSKKDPALPKPTDSPPAKSSTRRDAEEPSRRRLPAEDTLPRKGAIAYRRGRNVPSRTRALRRWREREGESGDCAGDFPQGKQRGA